VAAAQMKYAPPELFSTNQKTLGFGQYEGKPFHDIPIHYLRWMIKHHSWQWRVALKELERRKQENKL
jgi:hypothetical protein